VIDTPASDILPVPACTLTQSLPKVSADDAVKGAMSFVKVSNQCIAEAVKFASEADQERRKSAFTSRRRSGFTIVELIVVVTVISLLASIAIGASSHVLRQAKVTKSRALISTLATAKSMFAGDPTTTPAQIEAFNASPDASFASIAPYIKINGATPQSESDMLTMAGMPIAGVKISLGTIDDGTDSNSGSAPTVTGYGLK
jgi:prepilin-type N-terminal cleavage/methylation domain-containing protein